MGFSRLARSIKQARAIMQETAPFEKIKPNAKQNIVVIGDSSGYGTGAVDPANSIAGRLSKDFPKASIINKSKNGMRLEHLPFALIKLNIKKIDFMIIAIGGNDIVHFTSKSNIKKFLTDSLKIAVSCSRNVIILHGGNMGAVPVWPWPLNWIYSHRTRVLRNIYIKITKSLGANYVDLYTSIRSFPQTINGESASASDGFHPSDAGYALWYEGIKKFLG